MKPTSILERKVKENEILLAQGQRQIMEMQEKIAKIKKNAVLLNYENRMCIHAIEVLGDAEIQGK